jgi:hypothetical protein
MSVGAARVRVARLMEEAVECGLGYPIRGCVGAC